MGHINDLIDYTTQAFIVYHARVLLVDHKKQRTWLPPGGHIELDEDPEEALFREIQEESGLTGKDLTILSEKPRQIFPDTKQLYRPNYFDIHRIDKTHRHVNIVYFARSRTDQVKLEADAHRQIKWFDAAELTDPQYRIKDQIRFYAEAALQAADV